MNESAETVAANRAASIMLSLKRHRLVFVQMGSAHAPLREALFNNLHGTVVSVGEIDEWGGANRDQCVIVSDLDRCADSPDNILGKVRAKVLELLDDGCSVCLFSSAPRIAFRSSPGSSVLEDAALYSMAMLSPSEVLADQSGKRQVGWQLPAVTFGADFELPLMVAILGELGQGLIAALDHAIFDFDPKGSDGLQFLTAREIEGLRGSGLVEIGSNNEVNLITNSFLKPLREALSEHISSTYSPVRDLPTVVSGLWFIERSLRAHLRSTARLKFGNDWKSSSVGGLKNEVLKRAQLDSVVTAKSVNDLRDPLEWLTLGELLDIIRSDKFENLGIEPAIWRRLGEQLVPIRNRLAHVRMLKSNDSEVVQMWQSTVLSRLG